MSLASLEKNNTRTRLNLFLDCGVLHCFFIIFVAILIAVYVS